MKKLTEAYSPENFRKRGHDLIDQLADHFENTIQEKNTKVIHWSQPNDEHIFWKDYLKNGDEENLFSTIIGHSIHVHNPKYIGHQVTPTLPITALTAMLSASLNNGMAVYEMGVAASAIERIVTDYICKKLGYTTASNGILTSGGTLANLTALLAARKAKAATNVWRQGSSNALGIMVSEEAHYCVDRAARIMGLGDAGIIKIPSTSNFNMDINLLDKEYEKAKSNGIEIFAIIGSAPSTSTGIYDDLEALADFSTQKDIWFHVDGAHGGAAIFSKTYKHTVKGIEKADSIVIDGHKMMMMPALTTALLFKDGSTSHATFSQKADYLLEESIEEDWYNIAKRTFECTKTMACIHWYTILKTYGEEIFDEYVTTLYDLGHQFAEMVTANPNFEIAVQPASNIVCFRYVDAHLSEKETNSLNEKIRQSILEKGEFYIVQTKLRGMHYLRVTIMNPFTTKAHLQQLLDRVLEEVN
ncbi:aminotransferase class I/II-fold pyridoxal phosphate-dependent enzyme [Cellulophaga sp. 20_2_10]|uniref:pyridoxal phosphate-dependent decarboxylase family protein n=1 Tax=Cellulophaga sp. 20_2_10 TaxID=2942476 RepID=UPI00201A62E3|nr:aminotransferase class I/II-fold pyridoxal phosphate-dependent enzyme [Cellulophaga sp. 20_2_10]MCL5244881.1 aminotransferase class I/II-fold pyridoxal phosphate-dependent enzyme [Cellulophaga sp. 20_2_10]